MNVIKIKSKNEKKHQNCQKTLLPTKKNIVVQDYSEMHIHHAIFSSIFRCYGYNPIRHEILNSEILNPLLGTAVHSHTRSGQIFLLL